MNPVGKPDAGNPHVRFDERGRETEPLAKRLTATAPFLDSTPVIPVERRASFRASYGVVLCRITSTNCLDRRPMFVLCSDHRWMAARPER
jgi:hypothetical protein